MVIVHSMVCRPSCLPTSVITCTISPWHLRTRAIPVASQHYVSMLSLFHSTSLDLIKIHRGNIEGNERERNEIVRRRFSFLRKEPIKRN